MKLLTHYIEHVLSFERLAGEEVNPKLKAQFQSQATAYRKLAVERAKKSSVCHGRVIIQRLIEREKTVAAGEGLQEDV